MYGVYKTLSRRSGACRDASRETLEARQYSIVGVPTDWNPDKKRLLNIIWKIQIGQNSPPFKGGAGGGFSRQDYILTNCLHDIASKYLNSKF